MSIYYSLTKYSGIGEIKFIGLDNFIRLFDDGRFIVSLKNTCIILGISLFFLIPCAFLLANLLNKKTKGGNVYKALIFSPAIIAPIVVGLIWTYILDPYKGLINMFFRKLGLDFLALQWIGGKTLTPYVLGFVYSWQNIGFLAVIFLTGLKYIPEELYEAGRIDGTNKIQELFFITIPMIRETFMINIVLAITGSFKIFELVIQLTGGGPNYLSNVLVTYMYDVSFRQGQYGYGMSIAVITFLISIVFFLLYLILIMRRSKE